MTLQRRLKIAASHTYTTRLALPAVLISLIAGCSSRGSSHSNTTAVAAKATRSPAAAAPATVRSTLDGRTALPLRIHWAATPSVAADQISEVDFLIDGKLGWVEHSAPYYYGDDGNWLVISFLRPGEHTFTVRAITVQGKTLTDAVKASISAPPAPPPALRGIWKRMVTAKDVTKASSNQPPPTGRWELRIAPNGWQLRDPTPGAGWGLFDVAYLPNRQLQMLPTIEYPTYPNGNNGGFCEDTDPLWTWTYLIGAAGRTLTVHPVGHDPCGDRAAILEGTWNRVRPPR
jgi:hypothetical protein